MEPGYAPTLIDVTRPSTARVQDYLLGGAHNFAVDRALADELVLACPAVTDRVRSHRVFLRRAVRFLAGQGVHQFLDIGSGVPTVGSPHETARRVLPESTVVYVDIDPVTVAHGQAILEGDDRAAIVRADLRDPESIAAAVTWLDLIDFTRPVALLFAGVLHLLPDEDDPVGLVAALRDRLVTGGYLLVSHATRSGTGTAAARHPRPQHEILRFFDGTTLVEPGLVPLPLWRTDPDERLDDPDRIGIYAGIGRIHAGTAHRADGTIRV
ncbi:MAG: SAM-dependent methyltransferase [Micromonosporaceae bacterium]|nr:SAM-dependent methyltransferase [Micromonosporaceae bacterium]